MLSNIEMKWKRIRKNKDNLSIKQRWTDRKANRQTESEVTNKELDHFLYRKTRKFYKNRVCLKVFLEHIFHVEPLIYDFLD